MSYPGAGKLQHKIIAYTAFGIAAVGITVALTCIGYFYIHEKSDAARNVENQMTILSMALDKYVSKIIDISLQLTSRAQEQMSLESYNDGKLTLPEARQAILPKLADALHNSEIVAGIVQFDRHNNYVLHVGVTPPKSDWRFFDGAKLYGPKSIESHHYLMVSTPIFDNSKKRLGTDIVLFDADSLRQKIVDPFVGENQSFLLFSMENKTPSTILSSPIAFDAKESATVAAEALQGRSGTGIWHADRKSWVYAYKKLDSIDWVLIFAVNRSQLLGPLYNQIALISSLTLLVVVLGSAAVARALRPMSKSMLLHADELENMIAVQTARLRESELLNRTIVEHAAEGIIIIDEHGIVELFNAYAESLFGYSSAEVVGQSIKILMPPDTAAKHDRYLSDYFAKSQSNVPSSGPREVAGQHKNGAVLLLELAVSEISVDNQKRLAGIIRDISARKKIEAALRKEKEDQAKLITQLKEAQSQLLHSEKLASIGQLAAGVAHEINNPVGYINSNVSTLNSYIENIFSLIDLYEQSEACMVKCTILEHLTAKKQQLDLNYLRTDIMDLLKETQEGVRRVKQIVQDLKDFSHVDEGDWQWTDIHRGLESTLNIVHNELKYKAVVHRDFSTLPEVECLPSQLNQVFMNLLVNAGHAIEQRGEIHVRTAYDAHTETVQIAIQDSGKGIEPQNMRKIFDPFFTTKPVGKGTGLGLSISYSIIEKHCGRIDVQSKVGEGTTFTITLPIKHHTTQSQLA